MRDGALVGGRRRFVRSVLSFVLLFECPEKR